MAAQFYNHTSKAQGFWFLYILTNICLLLLFIKAILGGIKKALLCISLISCACWSSANLRRTIYSSPLLIFNLGS